MSSRPSQAAGHQMTSDCMSNTAGFQRPQKGILVVLLLRQLRHETLTVTAEEATKKSHPGAKASVGTSTGTSRN